MALSTYTELETRAFNLLVTEIVTNRILDTKDIANALDLKISDAIGVVTSLAKKGKVALGESRDGLMPTIWPVHPEHGACLWSSVMTRKDISSQLIETKERHAFKCVMTFANQFKQARHAAGLSQSQAAELLGVTPQTVKNWEAGRREPPKQPVLTQRQVIQTIKKTPANRGNA